uniref:peptide-methionine (S)-S-oxide reductase n=1 Tax=Plectus sambesii TaxID=2011161 RepID=A0A914XML3_9BILA
MTLRKAYIGMQCFWGVESSFAKLPGVTRTRVGYAGGTTVGPTYRNIGDHTEITEVEYDESKMNYNALLDHFWSHHDATVDHKKQYASAILYVDEEQQRVAEASRQAEQEKTKKNLQTYIQPLDKFYQAEDYHQKYWLRTQTGLFKALKLSDKDVVESPLATKLNAFMAGYTDWKVLDALTKEYNIDANTAKVIKEVAQSGGVADCH